MSKTNENSNNNLNIVEKRNQEKHMENFLSKNPKAKLNMRESLSEKDKRDKYYTCNSSEVLFFKISKKIQTDIELDFKIKTFLIFLCSQFKKRIRRFLQFKKF
jgi:hypothetical protein